MVPIKSWNRGLILLLLCCLAIVLTDTAGYGAKERNKTQASEYRTTQIELQSGRFPRSSPLLPGQTLR